MCEYPELVYFMNESLSDVVFIVEEQRLPALKSLLTVKNTVFRAMFSENFKESKEKEVVIKDTTFEAFKTLMWFLYCDLLVLKNDNDLQLIEDVLKLCDRYDAKRLMTKIKVHLKSMRLTEQNMESMARISSNHRFEELMSKVKAFIGNNFNALIRKDDNELISLNDSTYNQFFKVLADNYRKQNTELSQLKRQMDGMKRVKCAKCSKTFTHASNLSHIYCPNCGAYLLRANH